MKNLLIANAGSVQKISSIPEDIRALYKTVWEISQKVVIEMAADRGAYIDQSQSLNIHIAEPSYAKLTSMHFYAWKKVSTKNILKAVYLYFMWSEQLIIQYYLQFQGLKTGMYYLRTKPAANAIQFTVDKSKLKTPAEKEQENMAGMVCSLQNKDDCVMCGS